MTTKMTTQKMMIGKIMMKKPLFFAAAVIAGATALPLAAYAQGATGTASTPAATAATDNTEVLPSVNRVVSDIMQAEKTNNAGELVLAYGQAVRDPQLAKGALSALLYDFYRLRALAGSAMQVSQAVDETSLRFAIFQAAQGQTNVQQNQEMLQQNQKIIEQNETLIKQNERMIDLLDQIARKK